MGDPFAGFRPPKTVVGLPENGSRTYNLKRKLGSGACGIVYEYTDMSNKKSVAMKFPAKEAADEENVAFRLSCEINPDKSYDAHLSPAYESLKIRGTPGGRAQVWGWGGEGTLGEFVADIEFWRQLPAKPGPDIAIFGILRQMVIGLNTLHEAKFIHGDLHMDNIMFHYQRGSGKIKVNLIDFGLCMAMEYKKGVPSRLGKTARFSGAEVAEGKGPCHGYLQHPPELWLPFMRVKAKRCDEPIPWTHFRVAGSHDIWSVGVIFYHMVSLLFALAGVTNIATVDDVVGRMVKAIKDKRSDGDCSYARRILHGETNELKDDRFKHILDGMLEPDPSMRMTASDVLTFLTGLKI